MTKTILIGNQECTSCDGEVNICTLGQLKKYPSSQQHPVIEDQSSDEEYLGGGSGREREDESSPKITVVEEAATLNKFPTN